MVDVVFVSALVSQAICPKPLIKVEEGVDVSLPCHLDPPRDVSGYTVDWKRDGQERPVHVYRDRMDDPVSQMGDFRNRTSLNHENLRRGNLTLCISSVRLSDTGSYKCFVPKLYESCIVNLSITVGKNCAFNTV